MKTIDAKRQKNESTSLLTSNEWAFIEKISDLFPDRVPSIKQRFQDFEKIPPKNRLKEAQIALQKELRRGFVQRIEQGITPETSIDDVENIQDHSKNMRLILGRIFNRYGNHPFVKDLSKTNKADLLRKSFRLASIHDMPEAITSDFTPCDMKKISRKDKSRLEDYASRIIFEAFPRRLQMIERYEEKDSLTNEGNIDHLNKVVDILEGGIDCLAMHTSDACFNEWMGTIETGLKKYPELTLSFAKQALTDIRHLHREWHDDLVTDYPNVQKRREAIIELVF